MAETDPRGAETVRGRPRRGARRRVSAALLDAAEAGLRLKSHNDLTSREIATLAGANQAMIAYYFDGKDGLFSTLIENALKSVMADLQAFERNVLTLRGSPTRNLLALLVRHYYGSAPLYKVVMDELRKESSLVRQNYLSRASRTYAQICRILRKLVAAGIYRQDMNVRYAALMFSCVITTPVSLSPIIDRLGFSLDELQGDPWIDYVSAMFDREFAAAAAVRDRG